MERMLRCNKLVRNKTEKEPSPMKTPTNRDTNTVCRMEKKFLQREETREKWVSSSIKTPEAKRTIGLIHFRHGETLGRHKVIGESNVRLRLLGLFLEFSACNHHRDRRMGDQVVGERSEKDTEWHIIVSKVMLGI